MADEKKHELVPASDVFVAYAVFADYDGNAPDSENVILLASPELAEEVRQEIAKKHDSRCFVDGWEWAKTWRVRMAYERREKITTTFSEAKDELGEEDE